MTQRHKVTVEKLASEVLDTKLNDDCERVEITENIENMDEDDQGRYGQSNIDQPVVRNTGCHRAPQRLQGIADFFTGLRKQRRP